ncbi:MAG: hypothetical protein HY665_05850 [Chloroflexi bacterium]|nr:hypothetical protein [Chloroflexota bacterium]
MGIKTDKECKKGDAAKETLRFQFQVLVERSVPNKEGIAISLWKSQADRFEVASYNGKEWKSLSGGNLRNEKEAWEWYENACDGNQCSPYPEAETYYRARGRLK